MAQEGADADVVAAVIAREDALYAAMVALDYAALDGLLAEGLSYVHSTGVVESKTAYFAGLRRGLYDYGGISRIGGDTQRIGEVALTTGVIDMLVGARGEAKGTIRLHHILVWVREGGLWRLLHRQATRVPG